MNPKELAHLLAELKIKYPNLYRHILGMVREAIKIK